LWLCYGAVHGPITPAERHQGAYPNVKVPTPADIYPPRPGKPNWQQKIDFWMPGKDGQPVLKGGKVDQRSVKPHAGLHGDTLSDWARQYHQCVLAIDEGVGRLMQALDETGQRENTLVVFTSDQGFAWGQHGFRHKLAPYDATIRSPLIVSRPGTLPEGEVCEHPVAGVDLVPTFFRHAGIGLPWTMHGHDLTPLLQNPKAPWPHPALTILTYDRYGSATDDIPDTFAEQQNGGVPWWVSLRQGRYKYIRTLLAGEIEELYDLKADPEELDNLALKPAQAGRLTAMRRATVAELKRTGAGLVNDLPPVGKIGK
jgi:arylsulfatase A-like enzyme